MLQKEIVKVKVNIYFQREREGKSKMQKLMRLDMLLFFYLMNKFPDEKLKLKIFENSNNKLFS